MKLPLYHIDAFTSRVFAGNPAVVVPLPRWLADDTLQAIAAENNLSETAFLVGGRGQYEIRWLTPTTEVDLCGHATPRARDLMAVFQAEEDVRSLRLDPERVATLDYFAVMVTAPGREADFVSRFLAPRQGIPEDPVTGSAHCTLVPYWARRLGKPRLRALQVSPRGGELHCEDRGDRVKIAGRAVQYLEGTIAV